MPCYTCLEEGVVTVQPDCYLLSVESVSYVQKMWLGGQTEIFQNAGEQSCIRCINFTKLGGNKSLPRGAKPFSANCPP